MSTDLNGICRWCRWLGFALIAGLLGGLPARAATLNVTLTPLPPGSALDLPALGTLDWVHWGLMAPTDVNRRDIATSAIPNVTVLGSAPLEQTDGLMVTCSWTNGVPTLNANNIAGGVLLRGLSNGFQMALPADTQPRRLRVAVGTFLSQGRFTASLSDASAAPVSDAALDSTFEPTNGLYTLDFAAASAGRSVLLSFTMAGDYDPALAAIVLQAATLSLAPSNQPPTVTLACPSNQANFLVSDTILLCAEATDADGSVAVVEFYSGTTKLSAATNAPFTFAWTNATPGLHALAAAATDNLGARRVSAPIQVFVNTGVGLLTLASAPSPGAINLTTQGLTDWAHWGLETEASFNHKAGVSPQIGNYTLVGSGPAYAYFDNFETYTWTDGTPTASVFNYPAGVYSAGLGEGFEVRVAADTTVKTLQFHVGAFGARGRLQAWLDDYSGPVLFNQSLLNPGNGPGLTYTLQFRAGAPGRALVLRYTVAEMHDSFGNVTLQAASLVGENIPPAATLTTPTNHTVLAAPAAVTLRTVASDPDGSIVKIEYFRGATKLGETTALPHEWALSNLAVGSYAFTARATDDKGATFTTPTAHVHVITGGGVLSGSFAAPPLTVNLSAEGVLDWGHWGSASRTSFVRKQGVSLIPNVSVTGGTRQRYTDNATAFTWTNGTPTLAIAGTTTGIYMRGQESGFEFTVPADRTLRRLRLYVGLYGARGRFEASLSDFSAAPFVEESLASAFGNAYRVYTLSYAAASPAQSLALRWTASTVFDEQFGNVTWQAATLSLPDLRVYSPRWETEGFTFSVQTEAGLHYVVETTETLQPGSWKSWTNFLGTGAELDVADPGPFTPNRSYRLRVP